MKMNYFSVLSFVFLLCCETQILEVAFAAPNPQRPPGIIGTFGEWGNGFLDALNLTGNAFANGAANGFQGLGNGLQAFSTGFINTGNASANGLVNTFQNLIG